MPKVPTNKKVYTSASMDLLRFCNEILTIKPIFNFFVINFLNIFPKSFLGKYLKKISKGSIYTA